MKKLIIIGAGGHGKVVYDIAERSNRFESIFFMDDNVIGNFYKSEVIETTKDIVKFVSNYVFIVAIGSNSIREKIQKLLICSNAIIITLIDDSAQISNTVSIGNGSVVMPNVVVNSDAQIGDGVILNTASVIEHDCNISSFCHISPNATICGAVNIGSRTWIGAGATVINNLDICSDVVVGAGSVVVAHIVIKNKKYVGLVG